MKKFFALALAMVMTLSLAACGGKSGSSSAAPATSAPAASSAASSAAEEPAELSGDLVLYSSMTEGDLDALITCFNEKYPDVNVEVVNGSAGELTTRLQTAILDGLQIGAAGVDGGCIAGGAAADDETFGMFHVVIGLRVFLFPC